MSKFADLAAAAPESAAYSIGANPTPALTHEHGGGFIGTPESELFITAVTSFLGDSFYETEAQTLKRLRELTAAADPAWTAGFVGWLRREAKMRSTAIVVAAEYAAAGHPEPRPVISSAMARADEPAEMLGYWIHFHGRRIPAGVKRGIADAATRLYTQRAALKYDKGAWRMGDVIETVHPKAKDDDQVALFRWLMDRRDLKRRPSQKVEPPAELKMVAANRGDDSWMKVPEATREQWLVTNGLPPGASWEQVSGWLPNGWTAAAWEAVIPNMGYMALVRNLNNFDRAGVTPGPVNERLLVEKDLRGSRILPFRLFQAYRASETDLHKVALAEATDLATVNLPDLPGSTLILVDRSGSMNQQVGDGKSRMPFARSELAGFFAFALAAKAERVKIGTYDNGLEDLWTPQRHGGILRGASDRRFHPRGGTRTWEALAQALNRLDHRPHRVVIITDEQTRGVPKSGGYGMPVISWNIAGYQVRHAHHGQDGFYSVAGYSDKVMELVPMLAAAGSGAWPWMD